jgi:DNA-binding SARP family transcriptional activator/DNA-binding beta-propeller fold protein YncE
MAVAVQISVLGNVEATVEGQRVELGPPQQRELLALLALRAGAVVSVEAIVDVLWPEDPPATAAKVVQTYVSRLRRALGEETIARRGRGYVLDTAAASVDAVRFEQLLREGSLQEALALWRGTPLADLAAPALRHEADRLEELHLTALEEQIDAELSAGRSERAVADLQRLVALHPFRERLVARLMAALYAAGRQADALEVFRRARVTLVDELGIEPGTELKELERRILEHDPTLVSGPLSATAEPGTGEGQRRRRLRSRRGVLAAVGIALGLGATAATTLAFQGSSKPVVPVPNSIIRIDPKTNRIVEVIRLDGEPNGIAATKNAIWVADEHDRTVTRIDIHSHQKRAIRSLTGVDFLTRDERGNLYASGFDYPYVWLIDPRTVQVTARYVVRSRAVGMAVGAGSLWVVDRLVNGVTRFDLAHPLKKSFVKVGTDPLVTAFGFRALWVANSDDGTVSVIRPGAATAHTILVSPKPFGIAAGEGAVWVGSNTNSSVTRIDPRLGRVVARISVLRRGYGFSGLYSVAVGAGSVWASNNDTQEIARIDPKTNRVVAHIRLPVSPRDISVVGNDVWVSVAAPNSLP